MKQFVYRFVVVSYDCTHAKIEDGGIPQRLAELEAGMLKGDWSFASGQYRIRTQNGDDVYFLEKELPACCSPNVTHDVLHFVVSATSIRQVCP